ncbi:hypothetical protein JYU34_005807 [Plutella xylostella]|uniref:Uncharacterized protein n=1 Tax=Plutella xylostella TaxID=51655 RepID=A0ABQ7QU60_PLUXY|nr:hypothetical protein JYU34_005807 [Plutella xylostella]
MIGDEGMSSDRRRRREPREFLPEYSSCYFYNARPRTRTPLSPEPHCLHQPEENITFHSYGGTFKRDGR